MIFTYIDPGVGSALIQAIIASVIGFFYGIKVYGKNIRAFFKRKRETNKS